MQIIAVYGFLLLKELILDFFGYEFDRFFHETGLCCEYLSWQHIRSSFNKMRIEME